MPTISIWSNMTAPRGRQRFSRDLTVIAARNGLDPRRVLICWQEQCLDGVFLGPLCVAGQWRGREPVMFCRLCMEIDSSREATWRRRLLADLYRLARRDFADDLIFVSLLPVSPSDYLNSALASGADGHVENREALQ